MFTALVNGARMRADRSRERFILVGLRINGVLKWKVGILVRCFYVTAEGGAQRKTGAYIDQIVNSP